VRWIECHGHQSVFFSWLTAPNQNSYWLLSVKDQIGDGVKLSAVNYHNMLDMVHTIGMHDFPLGVGWLLLCRQDRGCPFCALST
jgi:hypothetical protein